MKYTQVINPQWANAEHTTINCYVDFVDLSEELVPFTAVASGDYEHTHQIFSECVAGKYGDIAEYVAPPPYIPTAEDNKQLAKQLLSETDWVNQPDVIDTSLTPHLLNHSEFIAYRSALRAIAINSIDGNLEWTVKPQEQWSS